MFQNVVYVVALFFITDLSLAYKSGAPADVCDSMTPEHGVPAQTIPSPYTIKTDKTIVKGGSKLNVIIGSPNNNQTFKGFFLQARDPANNILGTFDVVPNAKLVDCKSGTKNAITHSSPEDKKSISIPWTAPKNIRNRRITFTLTTAKNVSEYWINQKAEPVTVI